jgi:hypothetical protein
MAGSSPPHGHASGADLHGNPGEWELAAWPITRLLERASETGVRISLVLSSRALTDKRLEMAQKLDLYRLSARANLAHASTLPTINGASLLAKRFGLWPDFSRLETTADISAG